MARPLPRDESRPAVDEVPPGRRSPARRLLRGGARALRVAGLILLLIVVQGALELGASAVESPLHWQARSDAPVVPGAVRMVVLGDSAAQGIGAARPEESVAGRVVTHVEQSTGRPVHVTNLSRGGATAAEILRDQVPAADLESADLVMVIAGSNDIGRATPLEQFPRDLTALLAVVPAERTVLSDVPLQPGWEPYQAVLAEVADARGVRRADFGGAFQAAGQTIEIFAVDFTHLNSLGYSYWFEAFRPQVDAVIGT